MKTIIATLLVAFGAVLPVTQIQAAPIGNTAQFAKKTYGGFAVGKKFSFKVTALSSSSADLQGVVKKAPIPAGVPKFKKGQKVKFTIGAKGELKGPGFSIPFKSTSDSANSYVIAPTAKKPNGDIGVVHKTVNHKPTAANLSFFKTTGSGFGTKVYSVTYILQ